MGYQVTQAWGESGVIWGVSGVEWGEPGGGGTPSEILPRINTEWTPIGIKVKSQTFKT
jgi:hypothetical protein